MFYSTRRRRHAKKHAAKHDKKGRRYGRLHNPDWKIVGLAGVAGVGAIIAGNALYSRVEFMQKNWWALPAVGLLGGAMLLKKMPTIGVALATAGGVLGYIGYQANKANPQTAGFMDAGYWMQGRALGPQMRRDSGLFDRSQSGALLGAGSDASIRSQAGALLGAASPVVKASQASGVGNAGSIYASAMGLEA